MSILSSSRVYLLEIMKYILVKNEAISRTAEELCKMLVSPERGADVKFIAALRGESKKAPMSKRVVEESGSLKLGSLL